MKFMIEYLVRSAGLTSEQSMNDGQTLVTAFSKWKPEDGLKVHAFVGKVSGMAGYVLVEADDAKVVQSFVSKFNFWNDVNVVPVTDIAESVAIFQASMAWARAASKP